MYQLRSACLLVWPWLLVAVNAVGDDGPWTEPHLFQAPASSATRPLQQSTPAPANDPHRAMTVDFQTSSRNQYASKDVGRASEVRHASATAASEPARSQIALHEKPNATGVTSPTAATGPSQTTKAPLLLSHSEEPKPLLPADKSKAQATSSPTTSKGIDSLLTVLGSLGVVVGLFLVTMWCFRRGMPKSARTLPAEVVEVLGRSPLSGRQQMHVIRFGSKLVLAAVSPNGVDSISEITDPMEVDRLAGHCQQASPFSSTGAFRSLLDRLDERGPLAATEEPRRPNRGLSSLLTRRSQREEDENV